MLPCFAKMSSRSLTIWVVFLLAIGVWALLLAFAASILVTLAAMVIAWLKDRREIRAESVSFFGTALPPKRRSLLLDSR